LTATALSVPFGSRMARSAICSLICSQPLARLKELVRFSFSAIPWFITQARKTAATRPCTASAAISHPRARQRTSQAATRMMAAT
jgi:hypothetical protein